MKRKKKLLLNTYSSLINQLITVICGMILPRLFLNFYGSEVNGLISSITQFINFISFMELGIGAVVQSSLYKPLAEGDISLVSMVLKSADRFFKKVCIIFLIYLSLLMFLYPICIHNSFSFIYVSSLIFILSINLFAQYYFGIVNQLLLTADQKAYIYYIVNGATLLANTLISIVLINIFGANIHLTKLISSLIFIVRPIILFFYVKQHYHLDKNIIVVGEPIKQKWNGIAQHVSAVVLANTDTIILSLFSSLSFVSIYSVYYMVVNGINNLTNSFTVGFQSLFGEIIAKNEIFTLEKLFNKVEWMMHSVITILFTCVGLLLVPFISIYTKGINDANYIQPLFACLLTIGQALFCLRSIYYCLIKAAGHYKETQISAITEMCINIIISILAVKLFGLIGVTVGTLIAIIYRTMYCIIYSSKYILKRNYYKIFKQVFVDFFVCVGSIVGFNLIKFNVESFLDWGILAIFTFVIVCSIFIVINTIFYNKRLKQFLNKLRKKTFKY